MEKIFRKKVDKSVLTDGFTIKTEYVDKLFDALGYSLSHGENKNVLVKIGNDSFYAKLTNLKFNKNDNPNHKDVVQIRYSTKNPIVQTFREIFISTYKYIEPIVLKEKDKSGKKYKVPESKEEYFDFYIDDDKNISLVCYPYNDTSWIVYDDGSLYNFEEAFNENEFIYIKDNGLYNEEDTLYIRTNNESEKIYKCKVVEKNISNLEDDNAEKYWINTEELNLSSIDNKTLKIEFLAEVSSKSISKNNKNNIIDCSSNAATKVLSKKEAQNIENIIISNQKMVTYPEEDDTAPRVEGSSISIKTNRYERDPIARNKCIKHFGCKCMICGMDFEKIYGELGKGFINVHHLRPLYKVKKEHVVNYKEDLIPVCPNCHAMIHKLKDFDKYTVEELKRKLFK